MDLRPAAPYEINSTHRRNRHVIYDPEDPVPFQTILKRIRDRYHCTALEMVEIAFGRRPEGRRTGFPISPSSLNRFINGDRGETKVEELQALEHALAAHDDYKHLFITTDTIAGDAFGSFVSGMTRLFSEVGHDGPAHHLDRDDLGERLVGLYAIYRPSWIPFERTGHYTKETIISLVQIEKSDFGYTITDTQRFPHASGMFEEVDRGCLVAAGPYLYFLTKEQAGTTVRLGLFFNPVFIGASVPVPTFRGIWWASSHACIYAPLKFICRRIDSPKAVVCGPVDLDKIPHEDVRDYLQTPEPDFTMINQR